MTKMGEVSRYESAGFVGPLCGTVGPVTSPG
ncbi:hypothetical protein ABIB28_003132 [Sphingomonas sp. UYEF23]